MECSRRMSGWTLSRLKGQSITRPVTLLAVVEVLSFQKSDTALASSFRCMSIVREPSKERYKAELHCVEKVPTFFRHRHPHQAFSQRHETPRIELLLVLEPRNVSIHLTWLGVESILWGRWA